MNTKLTKPVRHGDQIDLEITALAFGGDSVGRYLGFAVFVPAALPGERVKVRITQVKDQYASGEILSILRPSPDRVTPTCGIFEECGGCQWQHLNYPTQLKTKRQFVVDALQRIGNLPHVTVQPCLPSPSPYAYRNKAMPVLSMREGHFVSGIYEPRSHHLVPYHSCPIQDDGVNGTIQEVLKKVDRSGLTPYQEKKHSGFLRHLAVRRGLKTGEILLAFVTRTEAPEERVQKPSLLPEELGEILPRLAREIMAENPSIVGVLQNINPSRTNVVFGPVTRVLAGKDHYVDEIDGLKLKVSLKSFLQVNTRQADILHQVVREALADPVHKKKWGTVLDLYSGIGTLSLAVSEKADYVVGVEEVGDAVEDAKANAQLNHRDNIDFLEGDVPQILLGLKEKGLAQIDAAILDPPRKGVLPEVLARIAAFYPERLVYVSCDPATLARDLALLSKHGFSVDWVQPLDMFPQTYHVETVVKLTRERPIPPELLSHEGQSQLEPFRLPRAVEPASLNISANFHAFKQKTGELLQAAGQQASAAGALARSLAAAVFSPLGQALKNSKGKTITLDSRVVEPAAGKNAGTLNLAKLLEAPVETLEKTLKAISAPVEPEPLRGASEMKSEVLDPPVETVSSPDARTPAMGPETKVPTSTLETTPPALVEKAETETPAPPGQPAFSKEAAAAPPPALTQQPVVSHPSVIEQPSVPLAISESSAAPAQDVPALDDDESFMPSPSLETSLEEEVKERPVISESGASAEDEDLEFTHPAPDQATLAGPVLAPEASSVSPEASTALALETPAVPSPEDTGTSDPAVQPVARPRWRFPRPHFPIQTWLARFQSQKKLRWATAFAVLIGGALIAKATLTPETKKAAILAPNVAQMIPDVIAIMPTRNFLRFELVPFEVKIPQATDSFAESHATVEVFRDGKAVPMVDGRTKLNLKRDTPSRRFIGQWPIPFNPTPGTYVAQVVVSSPLWESPKVFESAFTLSPLKPHGMVPGYAALTMEGGQQLMGGAVPALDGSDSLRAANTIQWAKFMGANVYAYLQGQTSIWNHLNPKDFPFSRGDMEVGRKYAKAAHEAGLQYAAYMTTFKVVGDAWSQAPYQFSWTYDPDTDQVVPNRFISIEDPRRHQDIIDFLQEMDKDPNVDMVGLDYVRTGDAGYEMVDEFVKDMSVPGPSNFWSLSRQERMHWLAKTVEMRLDPEVVTLFQWWRAHKVAMTLRDILTESKFSKPVFTFTLGWEMGHEHGQDPSMLEDAGIGFNQIMLYQGDRGTQASMKKQWPAYLSRCNGMYAMGEMVDFNWVQKSLDPPAPEELYDREADMFHSWFPVNASLGMFWHDLYRIVYGVRGPYSSMEWAISGGKAFTTMREAEGLSPVEVTLSAPHKAPGGVPVPITVEIRNHSPQDVKGLVLHQIDTTRDYYTDLATVGPFDIPAGNVVRVKNLSVKLPKEDQPDRDNRTMAAVVVDKPGDSLRVFDFAYLKKLSSSAVRQHMDLEDNSSDSDSNNSKDDEN